MQIKLKKNNLQNIFYLLQKVQERNKKKGIEDIAELKGDIKKLKGYKNLYRYKINHYRILFEIDDSMNIILVETINTRTNIKY